MTKLDSSCHGFGGRRCTGHRLTRGRFFGGRFGPILVSDSLGLIREEVETRKIGRNETLTFQGLFPGCTCRVSKKPGKEPDMNVSFPMKLAWQADCMFLFLRWKRNTWISKVSFGFRFNSAPQSKCTSRNFAEDQPGSRFSWCVNGIFDWKWSSRSNTWGSSATLRDLPLLSAC